MTTDAETAVETELDEVVETEGKPVSKKKTAIDASRGIGGSVFAVDPDVPKIVGFDTGHKRGEHHLWQARALLPVDEPLVQYMMKHGFPGIISVQQDGPNILVAIGRQRVKAAREANRRLAELGRGGVRVLCQVKKGSDTQLMASMISENAIRVEYSALDMASDVQNYINFGASDEEAATVIGKTVPWMRQILTLLDLAPPVQAAIRSGKLSPYGGFQMAKLTRDEQVAALAKIDAGELVPTAKALNGAVKAIRTGKEVIDAPKRALLAKIAAHKDAKLLLGEDGLKILMWVIGGRKAGTIRGLSELIREVSE